jgi:hypothetical protein
MGKLLGWKSIGCGLWWIGILKVFRSGYKLNLTLSSDQLVHRFMVQDQLSYRSTIDYKSLNLCND